MVDLQFRLHCGLWGSPHTTESHHLCVSAAHSACCPFELCPCRHGRPHRMSNCGIRMPPSSNSYDDNEATSWAETLCGVAAWLGTFALAVASWTPGAHMIRTGVGGLPEHAVAYLITAGAFILGYRNRSPLFFTIALAAYAAILEVGQMLVPGRHASLVDWAAGAAGALCAALLIAAWRSRRRS